MMNAVKHRIAQRFLPLEDCCGKGCKKCPYGRWIKRRPQTWTVLMDECCKKVPYGWWLGIIVLSFFIGLSV